MTLQHTLAIAATALAAAASWLQAVRSLEKARAEQAKESNSAGCVVPWLRLVGEAVWIWPKANAEMSDSRHFRRVFLLWLVILAGAALSLFAEILDA